LDAEDAPQGNQDTQSPPVAEGAPAVPDEGVAAETPAQETALEQEQAEVEAPETEESQEESESERPRTYTVIVDGKSEQVSLDEALAGYQRNSDYNRKTASLANERREFLEQAKAVSEERKTYATMLVALKSQLENGREQEPDWAEVYRVDPVGYARRRDEWRDKQEKAVAADFELKRIQALQEKEAEIFRAKQVEAGMAHLHKNVPAWKDEVVWETDRLKLVAYAMRPEVGYSREEVSNAYDPRAILLLHKARQWDELQAQQPKPVQPRGPRPAAAGAAPNPQAAALKRLNAAQQRLAKTGSIQDAAKVWEHFL